MIPRNLVATPEEYAGASDELTKRILALIPENKQILTIESVWDLFKIEGFECRDLGPSLFQAQWSLAKARKLYKNKTATY